MSPYRRTPKHRPTRYVVRLEGDGEDQTFEGQAFADVIWELRRAGYGARMISDVAATVTFSEGQSVSMTCEVVEGECRAVREPEPTLRQRFDAWRYRSSVARTYIDHLRTLTTPAPRSTADANAVDLTR